MENSGKRLTVCIQNLLFLLLPCLIFLLQYLTVPVTGDSNVTTFYPIEDITINCGSSFDEQSIDGRKWLRDGNGNFTIIEQGNQNETYSSTALKAPQPASSSVDKVPYSSARLSYSKFTYSIPLTAGQKFIRLYFYPTSYPGFDDNKAFFSVQAGPFTLLKNFSALLHAASAGKDILIEEFCVPLGEDQRLFNLSFIPSPDVSDSYAFINGIEIVSMPSNLYYTPASDGDRVPFIGQAQGSAYHLGNETALEKVYRVNVGGRQISSGEDTRMFRYWSDDSDYLTVSKQIALPYNSSIIPTFTKIPPFSAPREVYVTARSMGNNKTENEKYYLTWEFRVDSGFNYFIRLHFCEFQKEITKEGDRVFQIFLANSTAETQADIIAWSGGNGSPVYRDYVVAIGSKANQKQQNLSIALHTTQEWRTLYSDAILNGVEIFKLSNNFDLSGPNPDAVLKKNKPSTPPPSSAKSKNINNKTVIGIVGGLIPGLVVLSLLCFFTIRQKMRLKDASSIQVTSRWSQFFHTTKSTKSSGSPLPSHLCRCFSLAELKRATNNFDNVFIIGVGGFGNVYKGFIDGGTTQVAIKRLNHESQQGAHEFKTEIKMLSQLRHLHLVSLIGYCNDEGEMILVYAYMANGTLRDHLYNTKNQPLSWNQRLEICIGAARGLHYLHTGAKYTIIHRDVKTTNILLDDKWMAKVSDFGLSRVGPTNMSKSHVSTVVKGSIGYMDPEYYRRQQLTEKSDVYSFGVVLCEILCGRSPVSRTAEKEQVSLATWAQQCHKNGTLDKIIDPFLIGKIAPECLKKFTELAMNCLRDEGSKRPSMSDVLWSLEFALQAQKSGEEWLKPNEGAVRYDLEVDIDEESAPLKHFAVGDGSGEAFSSVGTDYFLSSKSISTFSKTTISDEQSFVN